MEWRKKRMLHKSQSQFDAPKIRCGRKTVPNCILGVKSSRSLSPPNSTLPCSLCLQRMQYSHYQSNVRTALQCPMGRPKIPCCKVACAVFRRAAVGASCVVGSRTRKGQMQNGCHSCVVRHLGCTTTLHREHTRMPSTYANRHSERLHNATRTLSDGVSTPLPGTSRVSHYHAPSASKSPRAGTSNRDSR